MDNRSVTNNIIWNTIGNIIYLGCQWLLSVVVVRASGNYADAGILTLAISVTNIFAVLAAFSVRNFQVSDVGGQYSQSDYIAHRVITCSSAMVLCIAFTVVNRYGQNTTLSIIAYMFMRNVETFADVLHGILQIQWRLDIVGRSCIYRGVILLLSFTVAYKLLGELSAALFCMAACIAVVFFLYDLRAVRKLTQLSCSFDKMHLFQLSKDCMPALAYTLFLSGIALAARSSLERYHGEEALGYYGTVSTIAVIVQSLITYIFNPFNGIISNHYANGNRAAIRKVSSRVLLILAAMTVVAIAGATVLGRFVLVLLFGTSIAPYAYLLIPAILVSCLTGAVWFLGMLLIIMRSMSPLIIGAGGGFAVSAVLSVMLIPAYKFDGANAAVISAFMTVGIIYAVYVRKMLRD